MNSSLLLIVILVAVAGAAYWFWKKKDEDNESAPVCDSGRTLQATSGTGGTGYSSGLLAMTCASGACTYECRTGTDAAICTANLPVQLLVVPDVATAGTVSTTIPANSSKRVFAFKNCNARPASCWLEGAGNTQASSSRNVTTTDGIVFPTITSGAVTATCEYTAATVAA